MWLITVLAAVNGNARGGECFKLDKQIWQWYTEDDLVIKDGAHYCYCAHFLRMPRQSRATRKKCATRRTRRLVLSPISLGGSSYFLRKRCVVFQQMKNNFYSPCQLFENRRSMRMLLFLRMIDLTEHFIVKQKSTLKHQKLLLQDVTLGAWVLKDPLIGKDQ